MKRVDRVNRVHSTGVKLMQTPNQPRMPAVGNGTHCVPN